MPCTRTDTALHPRWTACSAAAAGRYIRKHALEVTFKDELSRTERSERVTTELEAKKLGFYLFHNIKSNFDR